MYLKHLFIGVLGSVILSTGSTAHASLDLAKSKNCTACHAVEKKLVGPAFKDVAEKYSGDKGATARLAKKIQTGGVGVWGQIPMPANPQVTESDANTLVRWLLSTK